MDDASQKTKTPKGVEKMEKQEITLSLYSHQAWAFALFAKRTHWGTFKELSANEEEAYSMRNALIEVWNQFQEHGFAPR
jgi:hypothetical protein